VAVVKILFNIDIASSTVSGILVLLMDMEKGLVSQLCGMILAEFVFDRSQK